MSEWKDKYFEEKFKNLGDAVKENTKLTKQTLKLGEKNSERITKIEGEVFGQPQPKNLPPFYKDPKVVQALLYISLALLLLVAAATQTDIRGLLQ